MVPSSAGSRHHRCTGDEDSPRRPWCVVLQQAEVSEVPVVLEHDSDDHEE